MDPARQVRRRLAIAAERYGVKALPRPCSDLPCGVAHHDPTKCDGPGPRNLFDWLASFRRKAAQNIAPGTGMTVRLLAEGHEDIAAACPNSVAMAGVTPDQLAKMVGLEALVGSAAAC